MTTRIDPISIGFIIVALIAVVGTAKDSQAGEIPPPATHATTDPVTDPQLVELTAPQSRVLNHEARIANPIYVTELPQATEVVSKPFQVPPGWEMVEVVHPDKIACSAYPQAPTWELMQTEVADEVIYIQPVTVGSGNVDSITRITEGE